VNLTPLLLHLVDHLTFSIRHWVTDVLATHSLKIQE